MLATTEKLRKSPHCPTSNSFRPFPPCGGDNFLTILNSASLTLPCFLINYKKLVEKKDYEDLVSKMQIIEGGFGLHRQRRPRENRSGIG
jgi:hypothetical protein